MEQSVDNKEATQQEKQLQSQETVPLPTTFISQTPFRTPIMKPKITLKNKSLHLLHLKA